MLCRTMLVHKLHRLLLATANSLMCAASQIESDGSYPSAEDKKLGDEWAEMLIEAIKSELREGNNE